MLFCSRNFRKNLRLSEVRSLWRRSSLVTCWVVKRGNAAADFGLVDLGVNAVKRWIMPSVLISFPVSLISERHSWVWNLLQCSEIRDATHFAPLFPI